MQRRREQDPYAWADWLEQSQDIYDPELRNLLSHLTEALSSNGRQEAWPSTSEEWLHLRFKATAARGRWDRLERLRTGGSAPRVGIGFRSEDFTPEKDWYTEG